MTIPVGSRLYAPLVAFLGGQSRSTTTVTVTLVEIEQVIGQPLPRSASTQGWWRAKAAREQPRPWVAAGWRVAHVGMRVMPPTVTFARMAPV